MKNKEDCYHGGAFWEGIGADFASLERHEGIIPADVLDAWFPPAPSVIAALRDDLPFLLRTSPPTNCEGLIAAIAGVRGVPSDSIVVGAGSSDLIYRAFLRWLNADSVALRIAVRSVGENRRVAAALEKASRVGGGITTG